MIFAVVFIHLHVSIATIIKFVNVSPGTGEVVLIVGEALCGAVLDHEKDRDTAGIVRTPHHNCSLLYPVHTVGFLTGTTR